MENCHTVKKALSAKCMVDGKKQIPYCKMANFNNFMNLAVIIQQIGF